MAAPTYTYTSNTPGATDPMNVTQPLIRANFQAINELVAVNHVPFNTSVTYGMHDQVSMQFQTLDPNTASTDLAVYVKPTGSPNAAEIFYRYPNNGTINQLTPVNGGGTSSTTSGTGWCQYSSGIIMRWGVVSVNFSVSNGGTIIFPTGPGIPVFKQSIGFVQASLLTTNGPNSSNFLTTFAYGLYQTSVFAGGSSGTPGVPLFGVFNVNYFVIGL